MRLITFSELQQTLGGRGRTSIYRDIEQGRLPPPTKFGARCYWDEKDVAAAIERAAKASKTAIGKP